MAAENVTRFNGQVLRAIEILYRTHPIRRRLTIKDLSSLTECMSAKEFDVKFAAGTLKWLNDNEYVRGEFLPAISALKNAQLTAKAWRVLQNTEHTSKIQPLGEAVRQAVAAGGQDFTRVSQLLVRCLVDC